MNFQKIAPVPQSKQLLDFAFKKARKKGVAKKLKGNWLEIIRKKESLKLDVIVADLSKRLEKVLEDFPVVDVLSLFYRKLMKLTLDHPEFKKSLGAVNWSLQKVQFLRGKYVRKITKEKEREQIKLLSKEYYGRVSSIIKQISPQLAYLEKCRRIMRTYPDIKDYFTVCIYGFPNVGKTTLLNKLASTKAKTAAYAFTTTTINSGYLNLNGIKVQLLDVPGTLARVNKMNNVEHQAELVLKMLSCAIIYVFDLSGYSGYSLDKQERLFQKLKGQKNVFVYLSKKDLLSSSEIESFSYQHLSLSQLERELSNLAKSFSSGDKS